MNKLNKSSVIMLVICIGVVFFAIFRINRINNLGEEVLEIGYNHEEKENRSVTQNEKLAIAYQEFINNGGEFGSINYAKYYLYDISNDGQEELIIFAGTNKENATLIVYSYVNNEVVEIGRLDGEVWCVCANSKNNGIIVHYVENNIEPLTKVQRIIKDWEKKNIKPNYDFSINLHKGSCNPLTGYGLKDMGAFPKEFIKKDINNSEEKVKENVIPINSPAIGMSLDDMVEDYKYRGYTAGYSNSSEYYHYNPKYNLDLTGDIKYYWLSLGNRRIGYISRNGIIVDVRSAANKYENVYVLLHDLGYSKLLEYEPEIIRDKVKGQFLQWEIEDAYVSIDTMWDEGNDWKSFHPTIYCIYSKE